MNRSFYLPTNFEKDLKSKVWAKSNIVDWSKPIHFDKLLYYEKGSTSSQNWSSNMPKISTKRVCTISIIKVDIDINIEFFSTNKT